MIRNGHAGFGRAASEKDPQGHLADVVPRPARAPGIGKALTDRQAGQPAEAVAIAWSAQRRLHRTWARLEARHKRGTIIAVAAARELVGFCWAIAPNRVSQAPTTHTPRSAGSVAARDARGTRDGAMSNPPREGAGHARC